MIKWLLALRDKYFDYKIVGEYMDHWIDENGCDHYKKCYKRRWYLRRR